MTEEQVRSFFKDCGQVTSIRWLEKDGEFRGTGFAEFAHTDSTDKAMKKEGMKLGGRPIRLDYA